MSRFGRMLIGSLFAVAGIAVLAEASIVWELFNYIYYGDLYMSKGEFDRAIALYSRVIWFNPQDAGPYHFRGTAYYSKHDYEHAIADLSRAVELRPNDSSAFCDLGIVKFHAGDFKGASGDMLQCLRDMAGNRLVLFRFLARTRAGEADAAAELEANVERRVDTKEWPYAVIELYLGRRSPELTLDAASNSDEQCEAQFWKCHRRRTGAKCPRSVR
jgi:tetratricopeptide (TPR) repeat protein